MKTKKIILLVLMSFTLLILSCSKEEVNNVPPTSVEIIIDLINKFKPSKIRVLEGDVIYELDCYMIEECWLVTEKKDTNHDLIYQKAWNLNNVYSYEIYNNENYLDLVFEN